MVFSIANLNTNQITFYVPHSKGNALTRLSFMTSRVKALNMHIVEQRKTVSNVHLN